MKRFFCDACECEITPANRPAKEPILTAKSLDTENEFSFRVSYSLTAPEHIRLTIGPGDICKVCFVNLLSEAVDEMKTQVDEELEEEKEEEEEAFNARFKSILEDEEDYEEDEAPDADIDPEEDEEDENNDPTQE